MANAKVELGVRVDFLIFDLDGVLADSVPSIERAWKGWAHEQGIPWDDLLPHVHGRAAVDTIAAVRPGADPEWVQAQADLVNDRQVEDREDVDVFPELIRLYRSVRPHDLAVVTAAPTRLAVNRLDRRSLVKPRVMVAIEDVTSGKPDPEALLLAAERADVDPRHCAVIEDTPPGVEAARRAEMHVIGVTTTHSAQQLRRASMIVDPSVPIPVHGVRDDLSLAIDRLRRGSFRSRLEP